MKKMSEATYTIPTGLSVDRTALWTNPNRTVQLRVVYLARYSATLTIAGLPTATA